MWWKRSKMEKEKIEKQIEWSILRKSRKERNNEESSQRWSGKIHEKDQKATESPRQFRMTRKVVPHFSDHFPQKPEVSHCVVLQEMSGRIRIESPAFGRPKEPFLQEIKATEEKKVRRRTSKKQSLQNKLKIQVMLRLRVLWGGGVSLD